MELSAPTRLSAEDGPGEAPAPPAPGAVRRTLALRLAQRGRLRELRAERLARLRAPAPPPGGTVPRSAAPPPEAPLAPALPASPSVSSSVSPAAASPAASGTTSLAAPPEAAPAATAEDVAPLPRRKVAEEDAVAALEEFLRALTGGLGDPLPPVPALPPAPAEPAAVLPFQRRETADAGPERDRAADTGANPSPEPDLPPDLTVTAESPPAATATPEAAPPAAALSVAAEAPVSSPVKSPVTGLEQLPGAGPGLVWALGRAGVGSLGDLAALDPGALAERLGPIGRLVPAARWIAAARAAEAS